MNYLKTALPGVIIIEPRVFGDSRGYFFESFVEKDFRMNVGAIVFVQDNESYSTRGVVRGLHFQRGDAAQSKLVRAVAGRILDVAVDLRPDSPAFGRWLSVELTAENHRQVFIPRGFAHGFAVLSDTAILQYKCDNYYCPEAEDGIAWDDPTLAIDWQLDPASVVLSDKDRNRQSFDDYKKKQSL